MDTPPFQTAPLPCPTPTAPPTPPPPSPLPPTREVEDLLHAKAVTFLLGVRAQYLRGGASPLKAWDQIAERLRAASRRSVSVEEWATSILKGLQLSGPTSSTSSALGDLARTITTRSDTDAFLRLMEREWGAVIAGAQLEADRRRAARAQAGATTGTAPEVDDEGLALRDEIDIPNTTDTTHTAEDSTR